MKFIIKNGVLKKCIIKPDETEVVVPEGVTAIEEDALAFKNREAPWNLTLPAGVKNVPQISDPFCHGPRHVTLSEGITDIDETGFDDYKELESLTLPHSLQKMDCGSLSRCKKLHEVRYNGSLADWFRIGFYGEDSTPLASGAVLLLNGEPLKEAVFPADLPADRYGALQGCTSLRKVVLPEGLEKIPANVFWNCSHLTSLRLPDSVKEIGSYAFYNCRSLRTITLPEGLTEIGTKAFGECAGLRKLTIPRSLKSVDWNAFEFSGPFELRYNGDLADWLKIFFGNESANPLRYADGFLLNGQSLQDAIVPNGVKSIQRYALTGCTGLQSITLPCSVTSIEKGAFMDCHSLQKVTAAGGLKVIDECAFQDCENLKSIDLPASIRGIGRQAFYGCAGLESITVPAQVAEIHRNTFTGCRSLKSLVVLNPDCKFEEEALGHTYPVKLLPQFADLWPRLDEEDQMSFIKSPKWHKISPELQAKIFLTHHYFEIYKKTLPAGDRAPMAEAMVQLIGPNATEEECDAVAMLLSDFGDRVPQTTALALMEKLRASEHGAQALSRLPDSLLLNLSPESGPSPEEDLVLQTTAEALSVTRDSLITGIAEQFQLAAETALPPLRWANGKAAPNQVLQILMLCWKQQEALAPLLPLVDRESLQAALKTLADRYLVKYLQTKLRNLCYPICCYADETLMQDLCARWPGWHTGVSGQNAPLPETFLDAAVLSPTKAGAELVFRYGDAEAVFADRDYSALSTFTHMVLPLDPQSRYSLCPGPDGQSVDAVLQPDLSLMLEIPGRKKPQKTPPKDLPCAAAKKFKELRSDAEKVGKIHRRILLRDWLSGREQTAADWKTACAQDAFLRLNAMKLVWMQGERMFALTESGPVCADGTPFEFTDTPGICLAHPLDMTPADVAAWKTFLSSRNMQLLFDQLEEPSYKGREITAQRYSGCVLSVAKLFGLADADLHGFHRVGLYSPFTLDDCRLKNEPSWDHAPPDRYTLGKLTFSTLNRKVNHILWLLDRWTVEERIRLDNISVLDMMELYDAAQLERFIELAVKYKAVNAAAALQDYKQQHFPEYDAFSEFTLELM